MRDKSVGNELVTLAFGAPQLFFRAVAIICLFEHTAPMKPPPVDLKPVVWIGSSHDDLKEFPGRVQKIMGYALHLAQSGEKHPDVKPLRGHKVFKGAMVVEVIENFDGDTYRAAYTVKLAGRVYMLHAFQKKSTKGIATPKPDIDLIVRRLTLAKKTHAEWLEERDSAEKEKRD